jgi:hypothetical protein
VPGGRESEVPAYRQTCTATGSGPNSGDVAADAAGCPNGAVCGE